MQKLVKKIGFVWTNLTGAEDSFSMENRLYNLVCIIALIILLLLFGNSVFLHLWQSALIAFVVFLLQAVFYYYSRFKQKYTKSVLLNAAISYLALCFNFFVNSGSYGPTLFIFFLTFYLIIAITPNKLHGVWVLLHIITVCMLFYLEKMHPRYVIHNYTNNNDRIVDLVFTYIVSLVFTYFVIRYLRTYLDKQKQETETAAIKLKALFESSESCQVFLDRKMRIQYFNRGAADFFKFMHKKTISNQMDIRQLLHESSILPFENTFQRALYGEVSHEEQRIHYDNGETIWWHISYIPVIDNLENIIGVTVIGSDVTEAKNQQENIRRKNESLTKIAHTQAHDIRMPVVNILGIMELIKIEGYQNAAEYLPLMERAVTELDDKIKSIVEQTNDARRNIKTPGSKVFSGGSTNTI
ncbi:MAG: PAS domain-containing protein [Parafilimonas sp.]|nr:PAS domain-containing protein [Parafilimonas sp.]